MLFVLYRLYVFCYQFYLICLLFGDECGDLSAYDWLVMSVVICPPMTDWFVISPNYCSIWVQWAQWARCAQWARARAGPPLILGRQIFQRTRPGFVWHVLFENIQFSCVFWAKLSQMCYYKALSVNFSPPTACKENATGINRTLTYGRMHLIM